MNTYDELMASRKRCRICMETDPGEIHNGDEFDFDRPVISYWSQWLGHQKPSLLIVGQDFGNVGYFLKYRGDDDPKSKTNDNLWDLLSKAGVTVKKAPGRDQAAPVFLTNSILCLKCGPMSAKIKARWVDACAQNHLLSLTNYLNAPIVVGMGVWGWRAVRHVFQLVDTPRRIMLAAGCSWKTLAGTRVFPVGHCSDLGMRNRPREQQELDWQKIGAALRELPPAQLPLS